MTKLEGGGRRDAYRRLKYYLMSALAGLIKSKYTVGSFSRARNTVKNATTLTKVSYTKPIRLFGVISFNWFNTYTI